MKKRIFASMSGWPVPCSNKPHIFKLSNGWQCRMPYASKFMDDRLACNFVAKLNEKELSHKMIARKELVK